MKPVFSITTTVNGVQSIYPNSDVSDFYGITVESANETLLGIESGAFWYEDADSDMVEWQADSKIVEYLKSVAVDVATILDEDGTIMNVTINNAQTRTADKAFAGKLTDDGYEFIHPNSQREVFQSVDELIETMKRYAPLSEWQIELLD